MLQTGVRSEGRSMSLGEAEQLVGGHDSSHMVDHWDCMPCLELWRKVLLEQSGTLAVEDDCSRQSSADDVGLVCSLERNLRFAVLVVRR